MKAEWRTTAVTSLCRLMLDSNSFDVLPILGDALEDAGCDDAALLGACRKPHSHAVMKRRTVALVYSDETAEAVRWIEEFSRQWNFAEIARGHSYRGSGSPNANAFAEIVQEAMSPDGFLTAMGIDLHYVSELDGDDRLFWQHLETFTGKKIDEGHRESFGWSCSC